MFMSTNFVCRCRFEGLIQTYVATFYATLP